MTYELYYWPTIQGRGEFVRLALEEAGAAYIDVAREKGRGEGLPAMMQLLNKAKPHTPYAPPFLKAGKLLIGQTTNILLYLGQHNGLTPKTEGGRLWIHQVQLTIADMVAEVHDTHHPVSLELYYKDQKAEAKKRAKDFLAKRLPKFFRYFEGLLPRSGRSVYLTGAKPTYADLSLFQLWSGMHYAFPNAMKTAPRRYPRLAKLAGAVAARPRVTAYLNSERRIPFNQDGIFRHHPELDA